ncbi:C40 family peptidase [Geminocystis sp. GBBB08]|uniref:C40 family peptidase n=1 Tax=Geminocystis sp. GBBB08 TaxID=2604140 RepID=UPI0027E30800|nr:C40 family peptidase [Geminocystis sp. GBBB08]MBL1210164.1 NlpC/P60 family protein [Geminocystis sp. GBBB08]
MTIFDLLPKSDSGEYFCLENLNLYVQSDSGELATQAKQGRQLKIISSSSVHQAIEVCLSEDNYRGWLSIKDLKYLQPAVKPYSPIRISAGKIASLIPQVIEFTHQAMNTPNYYLWGGTVAPNYDCSGLIQSAFASVGVWLPRDSYQQEVFTQRISRQELIPGDLIFFGIKRVTHVALYLGDNSYIHSSGKEMGNNGIAINQLCDDADKVSHNYYQQIWSYGRVYQVIF